MKLATIGATLCLVACLFACTKKPEGDASKTPSSSTQPAPITLDSLDKRLSSAELDILLLQAQASIDSNNIPANISCTQSGADFAHTSVGSFPVSCESVTPYLDGYKVKLRIDNMLFAQFDGVDVHVAYGPTYQYKADESSTVTLLAGHIAYITVTLSPAKSSDVKTLQVSLKFSKWHVYKPT